MVVVETIVTNANPVTHVAAPDEYLFRTIIQYVATTVVVVVMIGTNVALVDHAEVLVLRLQACKGNGKGIVKTCIGVRSDPNFWAWMQLEMEF